MMTDGTNRVALVADRVRQQLDTGRNFDGQPVDPERLEQLEEGLALTLVEYVAWQDLKSRAHLDGRLSLDEAQTIYAALGDGWSSNGGWARGTDLATKIAVTEIIGVLAGVPR